MKSARKQSPTATALAIQEEIRSAEQRTNRRTNRHSGGEASYRDVDAGKLLAAVVAVTSRGCAIQFGYTKNGSSFVVRIVGDGEPYNEFTRPTEDFGLYLEGLTEDFSF